MESSLLISHIGRDVQTPEDFKHIPDDKWERVVKKRTEFLSWTETQKAAGAEDIDDWFASNGDIPAAQPRR